MVRMLFFQKIAGRYTRPQVSSSARKRKWKKHCPSQIESIEKLEARELLSSVLEYHNNIASTGVNLEETILTRENVNPTTFGKVFSVPVDGSVYAQVIVKDNVNITEGPNAGVHDVVFVATQNGSIYAIDGSASTSSGEGVVLWSRSLLDTPLPGATSASPVFRTDLGSGYPKTSITGTPIIDPATNTLFVVVASRETVNGEVHFVSRLHALNISDGTPRTEPALIGDTVNHGNEVYTNNSPVYVFGTGDGRDPDGRIRFNALRANQRPALRIFNGVVYAAWASFQDRGPYHGWIVGWDVNTLELRGVFNSTPNGGLGGIWQSGGGISSDGTSLYFETGNGTFDGRNGNLVEESDTGTVTGLNAAGFPAKGNYGNSFVRLDLDPTTSPENQNINGWGLKVTDYFTPFNQEFLDERDLDLGSSAPLILPDEVGSAEHPQLLIGAGKEGKIYVLDRNNLGKFGTRDNVVQGVGGQLSSSFDTAAYYQNTIYYVEGFGGTAKTFAISNGRISETPTSRSHDSFTYAGSTPSISANGDSNGIVWDVDRGTNQLRAYSSDSYAVQLYHSDEAAANRDRLGTSPTFQVPTVVNGHVYLGTADGPASRLVAYGLIEPPNASPAAPTNLKAETILGTQVTLSWNANDTSPNIARAYIVERSEDGGVSWTQTTAGTATNFTVGGLKTSTTYAFRVGAFNSVGASGFSNLLFVTTTADAGGVDFRGGFDATSADVLHLNGAAVTNGALVLTDGAPSVFQGVFTKTKQDITRFSTSFDFQISPGASSNGFTFAIQSDDSTPDNRGWQSSGGEGLAYGSLSRSVFPNSIAIKFDLFKSFDLYETSGENISTTGLYANGAMPVAPDDDLTSSGIDLHSGNKMNVVINYDAATENLSLNIVDTVTNAQFSKLYSGVNLPDAVKGGSAYVGFTAASGRAGNTAIQRILNWDFAPSGPPENPTDLTAIVVGQTSGEEADLAVKLKWANVADATEYIIERRIGLAGNYEELGSVSGSPAEYVDESVSTQANYFYRIKARNSVGDSAFSDVAVATTPGRVPTPRFGHAANRAADSITLAWEDFATNEDGFNIFRRSGAGAYTLVASLPRNPGTGEMGFVDTGLDPDTNYDYHILAFNLVGYSDFTGVNTGTTGLPSAPEANFQYLRTPRTSAANPVLLKFSEPISGFFKNDLTLMRNGSPVSLASAATSKIDDLTYAVDLSSVTASAGDYVLRLLAASSGIVDGSSTPLANDAELSWTTDKTVPQIISFELVSPASATRTNADSLIYELEFSEPVSAVALLPAISFGLSAKDPIITTTDNRTFTIVAGQLAGQGVIRLELNRVTNGISDTAGNVAVPASYPTALEVVVDRVEPSVTATSLLLETGSSGLIEASHLLAEDGRVGASDIVHTIDTLPEHLSLKLGGVALGSGDTFTQLDINTGRLSFKHDGGDEASDRLVVRVSDGLNETSPRSLLFSITTIVNQPPAIASVSSLMTQFESEFVVRGAEGDSIEVSDSDAGDTEVKVTLTATFGRLTVPTNDSLTFLRGFGTLESTMTFAGTVSDVNRALSELVYTPRTGYTGAASISVTVDDQGNDGTQVAKKKKKLFSLQVLPWVISGNTLRVAGTNSKDEMTIDVDDDRIQFVTGATTYEFARGSIVRIGVYGYAGDDQIVIAGTRGLAVNVRGAAGDDEITVASVVTSGVLLDGGEGNDLIVGGSGADSLIGGSGSDTLVGGSGNDRYTFGIVNESFNETDVVTEHPNGGVDLLDFGALFTGVDVDLSSDSRLATHVRRTVITSGGGVAQNIESAFGGTGDDRLLGNLANNWLGGSIGNDTLSGREGDDTLVGREGRDRIVGGYGSDELRGGEGSDRYLFSVAIADEADVITELAGEGTDTLDFFHLTTPVIVDLTNTNVVASHLMRQVRVASPEQVDYLENAFGGEADDTLDGNATHNVLVGNGGDDRLRGGDGNDRLYGVSGQDSLIGGAGGDLLDGGSSADRLIGGDGGDTLDGGSGSDVLIGGRGDDRMDGGHGDDSLSGDDGDDRIDGKSGDDELSGGLGNDTLLGGFGGDVLRGDAGNDRIRGGRDDDFVSGGLGNDFVAGEDGNDIVNGGDGADVLDGGAGDDLLSGDPGNDFLFGAAGSDTLLGREGDDMLDGGTFADTLIGGWGNDTLMGQAGRDRLLGGRGNDSVEGGAGNDFVVGEGGNDFLDGGAGNDSISGAEDSDTLLGGFGLDTLRGGAGNDRLRGGRENDILDGGAGDDELSGEDGEDTIISGNGRDSVWGLTGIDRVFGMPAEVFEI